MVRQILNDIENIFPHPKLREWLAQIHELDPTYEYTPPTNSLDGQFENWYNRTRSKIKQNIRPDTPIYKWITTIERVVTGSTLNEEFVTCDTHLMSLNDDFVEDHFYYKSGIYNIPEVKKEYIPNRTRIDGKSINWKVTDTNRSRQYYDTLYSPDLVKELLELNDDESNVPIKKYVTVDGMTYSIPYFISKQDFANFSIGDLILCMKAGQITEDIRKKYYQQVMITESNIQKGKESK